VELASSARLPGVVGDYLLAMLERRLDNVVFRLGFAVSRRQARQIVNHGHVQVNGGKVDIPSYQVADGDIVEIRERSREHGGIRLALDAPVSPAPPAWLEFAPEDLRGRVLGGPSKEDLESTQLNAQLIVELYSR
ncbi:MAG: 30S ribosomal protein S4, partial [Bryobacterales bacterium]|nr:30S ribosomal protein S4 [Bryobacterales bacterium]